MSYAESFEAYLFKLRGYCYDSSYATNLCDCLKAAHEREIEQARDPQRIGGRLERGSFEYAIEQLREFRWQHATNDEDAIPYINGVAKAHAQSLKREYHRGFEDGRHSMDAEHRAVAMRLRQLPRRCTGYSDAHVSWFADLAWAMGIEEPTFAVLRDELVRLMGGVSEPTADQNHGNAEIPSITEVSDGIAESLSLTMDKFIEYVEEDTRRLKGDASKAGDGDEVVHVGRHSGVLDCACDAVRGGVDGEHALGVSCHHGGSHVADGMVPVDVIGGADDNCGAGCCCAAADSDGDCGLQREEVSDGRVADDSGADTGCGDGGSDLHLAGLIYDTLWNERHEVVRALRDVPDASILSTYHACMERLLDAVGVSGKIYCESIDNFRDRLIHLLGGDQPSGIDVLSGADLSKRSVDSMSKRAMEECEVEGRITDELRELIAKYDISEDENHKWLMTSHDQRYIVTKAYAIADHIDEQFGRICQQQEDVLQSTIEGMVKEYEHDRLPDQLRVEKLEAERDELRDEDVKIKRQYAQLCVERSDLLDLLRDAAKEYMTTQAVCDELRYQREELMGKWIRERAERQELQARLNKANGENKGLRLSIDEQKESIAQRKKTIGKLTRDNTKVWKTVHELQAKLDEYDRTRVELPRDANGEVFRVGCTVRMVERHPEVLLTVHSMTLCDDGVWRLYAYDDEGKYSCNLSTESFEVHDRTRDTAESIVRDLSIGAVTESDAVKRIEALNG